MRSQCLFLAIACMGLPCMPLPAAAPAPVAVSTTPDDMLATGNEWLALPSIRASDGALADFNVLSMRDRGLLQVVGEAGRPALEPRWRVDGHAATAGAWHWSLRGYWIPSAQRSADGIDWSLTWCAPPGQRAAFLRLTATNRRAQPATVALGVRASFGALQRVTYTPVPLRGELRVAPAPWVSPAEAFSYVTDDTRFAWSLLHPGMAATLLQPPASPAPGSEAQAEATLAPGASSEALFVLAAGTEEFSAAHAARALRERLDREGAEAVIAASEAWALARTRATGDATLDALVNRNYLFTALYAWGRTLDTEELVGVTSRSPHYYVSAAWWDRDALLWSFPALLDIDRPLAREALAHAFGRQLRNAGTHSRFIDGTVLEDGFQLDEAAAPLIALGTYVRATGDLAFASARREAIDQLLARLANRRDAATGLYASLQDAQDEFQRAPFITVDNALTWQALGEAASLLERLREPKRARALRDEATALRRAIVVRLVDPSPPGGGGPVLAAASDGATFVNTDIPPASLMRLPAIGFIDEHDPLFTRTWQWLHSGAYAHSHSGQPYGLPGSYRLPFTPVWTIADELRLAAGREHALAIVRASPWDAGIFTEGLDPATARPDHAGRAFATAAGYLAHALCAIACLPNQGATPP